MKRLEAFSDALFEQLNYYDMQLIGGDTTAGPLSMTPAIHGYVPAGRALKRSGAKPGRLDLRDRYAGRQRGRAGHPSEPFNG